MATTSQADALKDSKEALKKLPILGPAMWLYARDDQKKYTFIAEQDWLLLPPIILDQCKLYTRDEIPWAFCTWANVSDEIDARLKSTTPKIAPHEWQSGTHLWLIDITAPFGDRDALIADLQKTDFNGVAFSALLRQPDGSAVAKHFPAITATH